MGIFKTVHSRYKNECLTLSAVDKELQKKNHVSKQARAAEKSPMKLGFLFVATTIPPIA
jgi:hypothetical protein